MARKFKDILNESSIKMLHTESNLLLIAMLVQWIC